jgi:hypothetical protein
LFWGGGYFYDIFNPKFLLKNGKEVPIFEVRGACTPSIMHMYGQNIYVLCTNSKRGLLLIGKAPKNMALS